MFHVVHKAQVRQGPGNRGRNDLLAVEEFRLGHHHLQKRSGSEDAFNMTGGLQSVAFIALIPGFLQMHVVFSSGSFLRRFVASRQVFDYTDQLDAPIMYSADKMSGPHQDL